MKSVIVSVAVFAVVLGIFAVGALSNDSGLIVGIKVSPHVIVIKSKSTWVTVHADIPYSQVAAGTVTLNEVSAKLCFADDCGDLVATFAAKDIKAIVSPPQATLTLAGATKDDVPFSGSETVAVKK